MNLIVKKKYYIHSKTLKCFLKRIKIEFYPRRKLYSTEQGSNLHGQYQPSNHSAHHSGMSAIMYSQLTDQWNQNMSSCKLHIYLSVIYDINNFSGWYIVRFGMSVSTHLNIWNNFSSFVWFYENYYRVYNYFFFKGLSSLIHKFLSQSQ
jgi:hypothetical protein